MPEFRIHFTVVINKCLRSKWRKVEARTLEEAIDSLWEEFGWIKVWKTEVKK